MSSGWVPVIESEPKYYQLVLVCDDGMYHLAHRVVNPIGWQAIETGMVLNHVTHWRPLPDLPSEEEV